VDASPSDLPADGTSTSTVTVTVLDSDGDPVVGDTIAFSARLDDSTNGACGTLGGQRLTLGETLPVTNAAGQATATYTAGTSSAECYVEATDLTQGNTNEAIIYQGADTSDAPSVTQTLPASLAAGGAMSTFTATATNPSSTDIADARFDLYITGDSNGSAGVDASQLQLSYKDDATGGDFVNVPLTGSTANGGVIDGSIIPDTAESLGAGATRTATFELSLAAGAPDTATTGAPLQIETDLDNFNSADASQANLDRAGPAAVPVVQAPGDTVTFSGKFSDPDRRHPDQVHLHRRRHRQRRQNRLVHRKLHLHRFELSQRNRHGRSDLLRQRQHLRAEPHRLGHHRTHQNAERRDRNGHHHLD
jgi:hypothetical protein